MGESFGSFLVSILIAIAIFFLYKKYFYKKDDDSLEKSNVNNGSEYNYSFNSTKKNDYISKAEDILISESDGLKKEFFKWYIDYKKDKSKYQQMQIPYFKPLSDELIKSYNDLCYTYKNMVGDIWYADKLETKMKINNRNIYNFFKWKSEIKSQELWRICFNSDTPVFYTKNSTLYFLPTVFIEERRNDIVNIKSYNDLKFKYYCFLSSINASSNGATFIGNYWEHTNSDGTKDLRFKDNKKLDIFKYGCIEVDNYSFVFSIQEEAKNFNQYYNNLLWAIKNS